MAKKAAVTEKATAPVKIAVLQRGWVGVGRFYQDGHDCRLERARIIRIWGTTNGLPEIANGGPTPKTVLDGPTTLRFHELTVVMLMDCAEEKWATILV